jgi:16S rRNA (cytidine1402-2'-O)-methyltransferase
MGTLYVISTPIGNLEDVTLRALRILREVDAIYAEDTRRTRVLLDHHGVAARPRSLHAHNERARSAEVLERLARGESVALVSDAGTPLLSDPGERLVAAVAASGHSVVPVPGASAILAALVASGLRATPFTFLGFWPRRAKERRALLERLVTSAETWVFFESPRRLGATLAELAEAIGSRRACVARELTKLHEETVSGTLPDLAERFVEGARGEVTVVLEGTDGGAEWSPERMDARIAELLADGLSARDAAAAVAAEAGCSRRRAYARALALREDA